MSTSHATAVDEAKLQALIGEMVGDMSAAISGARVLIDDKCGLCKALAEGGPAPPDDRAGFHLLPARRRDVVQPDPGGVNPDDRSDRPNRLPPQPAAEFSALSTNSDPNQNGGNHERHAEDHVLDELFT